MQSLSTILAFLAGAALIPLMLQDSFEVMLLPRRVQRRWRLMGIFFHVAWALWAGIGRMIKSRSERERFLSLFGPISMVGLFSIWAAGLVTGFGLVYWSLERHLPAHYDLASYVYMSGTTLVTLGYGDFTPHTGITKAIAVTEAATGFGLLAVVIGYLPVLYQLFSRRETHVMQLGWTGGFAPDGRGIAQPSCEQPRASQARWTPARLGKVVRGTRREPPLLSHAQLLPVTACEPELAGGARGHHGLLRDRHGRRG